MLKKNKEKKAKRIRMLFQLAIIPTNLNQNQVITKVNPKFQRKTLQKQEEVIMLYTKWKRMKREKIKNQNQTPT